MNLDQLLQNLCSSQKIVIEDNHRTLTGKEFFIIIRDLANQLQSVGIKDKKICLLRMTNTIDSVAILFASLVNRAVVFIANPHDPIGKICDTLERFPIFALLTDRATSITVQKKISERSASQIQAISNSNFHATLLEVCNHPITHYDQQMQQADIAIFSSGSTGEPKAILHKLDSLLLNAQLHIESIGMEENDRVGIILPLYYSYGLVANLFSGLINQSTIYLNSQIGLVDEGWIEDNKISALSVTPFIARKIQKRYPSLRIITIGGDILYSKQAKCLLDLYLDCAIFSTYGLTEAGPRVATCNITASILEKNFILPLGKPLSGVSLSIEDNSGHGELCVNTPTHMLGYYQGNRDGFSPHGETNTLVKTGDLYEFYEDCFYFIGRKKKIIFQGGEKVFPLAVESVIHNIDGVLDVMVASIQDKDKGQLAKAYIVASENLTLNDIRKQLKQRLSGSTIPEQIEFVDAIPRTITGKIRAEQITT